MPLLKRVRVMAAEVETTIGTDAGLLAANASFNAYDVMIQPSIEMTMRESQGAFGHLESVPGGYIGKATFKTDMGWDGTSTEPTWASTLFPACGWVDNGSGVFYPKSEAPGSSVKTLTIGCYENGKLKSIKGAVGNFKIVLNSGKMCVVEWEFTGVWIAPSDVAILTPTYPTASPLRFAAAAAVTIGAVSGKVVESVTIDAGNEVVMRESAMTAAGFISGIITDRTPKITINPESVLIATQDLEGIWLARTPQAITIVLQGADTSYIELKAPYAQIINIQEGDRNKMVIDEIELQCNKNSTTNDQELYFTFSATV